MKIINVIVVYGDRVHRVKSFPILDIAREEVVSDIVKEADDCFVETVQKFSKENKEKIRELILPYGEYRMLHDGKIVSIHLVNSEVVKW